MFLLAIVAVLLVVVAMVLIARAVALPRLHAAQHIGLIADYGMHASRADASDFLPTSRALEGLALRLGRLAGKKLGISEPDVRKDLVAAGIYRLSPTALIGYRVLATAALPFLLVFAVPEGMSPVVKLGAVAYGVYCGWAVPMMLIRRRARARLREIDLALPNMIELIVVTVEAGLGFSASMQAAADKLSGPLGDELRLMLQEQRMGLSTADSLRHLADRADTPAMRSFARAVIQGQELGVSIGQIMRALALDMRKMRTAAAQEQAHKAPVKMLFPMVFLLFPAMFIVMLGPAILDLLSGLSGMGK